MPAFTAAQVGFKKEVTWNTPVTVDRFAEFNSEGLAPETKRIESAGLRAGNWAIRADRHKSYILGYAGTVDMEVHSKGFGFWLEHLLGDVTTGSTTDSATPHTATNGPLLGTSFTLQSNRPLHPADTDQAFTYSGGKIAKWKLSNKVDELLVISADMLFGGGTTATAKASASYPAATEIFSFVGATLMVDGDPFDITEFEFEWDNMLDRGAYMRGSGGRKEPVQEKMGAGKWKVKADFDSLDQYDRFISETEADNVVEIVATWTGSNLIGTSSLPTLELTLPAARFDGDGPGVPGPEPLTQEIQGIAATKPDGTKPVSLVYTTADATP